MYVAHHSTVVISTNVEKNKKENKNTTLVYVDGQCVYNSSKKVVFCHSAKLAVYNSYIR